MDRSLVGLCPTPVNCSSPMRIPMPPSLILPIPATPITASPTSRIISSLYVHSLCCILHRFFVLALLCLRYCACVIVLALLCLRYCACVIVLALLCLRYCACVIVLGKFHSHIFYCYFICICIGFIF
jgi:hypothetical protein